MWPADRQQLEELQRRLAERWASQPAWHAATDRPLRVGGVFVASQRVSGMSLASPRGVEATARAGEVPGAEAAAAEAPWPEAASATTASATTASATTASATTASATAASATTASAGAASAGAAWATPAWAAAAVLEDGHLVDSAVVTGRFEAPYEPGLLALREGRLLEQAIARLRQAPDVVLVNATGRDHPRRAGLALHLGAACDLPTVGVTDRPLLATGAEPGPWRGAASQLWLDGELVGYRLRTRADARALVVHAAWRVDAEAARVLVLQVSGTMRTPAPLREARRLARTLRASG